MLLNYNYLFNYSSLKLPYFRFLSEKFEPPSTSEFYSKFGAAGCVDYQSHFSSPKCKDNPGITILDEISMDKTKAISEFYPEVDETQRYKWYPSQKGNLYPTQK